jgi:hypothetical protein
MTVFVTERFPHEEDGDCGPDGELNRDAYSTESDGIELHGSSSSKTQGYSVIGPLPQDELSEGPAFEVGLGTRNYCLAALSLTWAAGIALLVTGVTLLRTPHSAWMSQGVNVELATLALNVCLTGLMEGNGFIHTTSLRWALHLEGRLAFNSNLRLFTSSSTSKPNSWCCNAVYAVTTITSYASASLFFQKAYNEPDITVVHPAALLLLGSSLLLMATLVTWSLRRSAHIFLAMPHTFHRDRLPRLYFCRSQFSLRY